MPSNSSRVNDAAAALTLVADDVAIANGLEPLAVVRAWANAGVEPRRTGMAVRDAVTRLLDRAGRGVRV